MTLDQVLNNIESHFSKVNDSMYVYFYALNFENYKNDSTQNIYIAQLILIHVPTRLKG